MCGFVGVVSINDLQDDDISNVIKGLKRIINRGPNNQGFEKGPNYYFGHNRLQIVDLSDKSNQPLVSNDKKNILIFNGEIYNYKELRNLLKNKYEFNSKGDSEVLLAGLSIYGKSFLESCNGMYSFAFLNLDKDNKIASLMLSRDSFGQKPLFYCLNKNTIYFSSTIESLPIDFSKYFFDKYSIAKYLHYGYIPAPLTIINGVYSSLPGYVYEFQFKYNSIIEKPPSLTPKFKSSKKFKSYDDLFVASLEQVLESDASLGVAFSSGRDSVQIACGLAALGRKDIPLINVDSYDPKFSESLRAEKIANYLGLPFVKANPNELNIFDEIDNLYYPFADSSYLMSKTLYKSTPNSIKVVINGDGGDEIYCSYPHYKKILKNYLSIPRDIFRNKMSKFILNNFSKNIPYKFNKYFSYYALTKSDPLNLIRNSFFSPYDFKNFCLLDHPKFSSELNLSKLVNSYSDFNDVIKTRQNWDQYFHLSNCLCPKTDISSMSYSIEARSPYLTSFFREGLYQIKSYEKLASKPKLLQENYISAHIDKSLLSPYKQGFEFGLKKKFIEIDRDYLLSKIIKIPWLRKNSISKLLELNKNNQPTQEMIYGILVLSAVFKNFSNLGVKTDY